MTIDRSRRILGELASWVVLVSGCAVRSVDPRTLPADIRPAYALFESRCSKCHTIARPLNAPVHDTTHWELYVARMRRTPGSGISPRDATEILRFLDYYTNVIRGEGRDRQEPERTETTSPEATTGGETPSSDATGITFDEETDDGSTHP